MLEGFRSSISKEIIVESVQAVRQYSLLDNKRASFRNDLQGIRAIAITSVLFYHFYPSVFPNGHVGVDQFFVLSGFLMSVMSEREEQFGTNEIICFYFRRVKRILPSYLLMIFLALLGSRIFLYSFLHPANLESARIALLFTTNIEATDSVKEYQNMVSKASDLFTHTWSIAVEMQFYLIFPAIVIVIKLVPDWIALTSLKILGALSLLYHVKLPPSHAFNYVQTRLWQFVLGIYVHRLTCSIPRDSNLDATSINTYANKRIYLYYLAGVFCTSFFVFVPLDSLIIRITSTFLTAGLILYYPHNEPLFISSKYIAYLGNISYSLYLVHWPIFIMFKQNYIDDPIGLTCGILVSVMVAIAFTEIFEKFCMRAGLLVLIYIMICLYASTIMLIQGQETLDYLRKEVDWSLKLFTPVCSSKNSETDEDCDIPFNGRKLPIEQVLRLNDLFTSADTYYLYYEKCSYRRVDVFEKPWAWCDLPLKRSPPKRKILVIGNSYATNQGRLVYEMCHDTDVEVKIFTIAACEVLAKSATYEHCKKSNHLFLSAVKDYKPDLLFILVRYTDMNSIPRANSTTATENIVKEASVTLSAMAQYTKEHVFVLDALPRPQTSFMYLQSLAISSRSTIRPITLLNTTSGVETGHHRLQQVLSTCIKCSLIDYTPIFTYNGIFHFYDPKTNVALMNGLYHLTPLGLHRLRPLFKNICGSKSNYSRPAN